MDEESYYFNRLNDVLTVRGLDDFIIPCHYTVSVRSYDGRITDHIYSLAENLDEAIGILISTVSHPSNDYSVNLSGRFTVDYRQDGGKTSVIVNFGDPAYYGQILRTDIKNDQNGRKTT